ncbi:MAG: hypothetical protein CVV56_00185 [Tenericutes bacterium HGW-Tenericutes-1]|jgi:spore coat protein CotH|nr:MAG: hypothetical protein CVV56_00185 [Tenericutes bacterium HGW-Tenericutes-1]
MFRKFAVLMTAFLFVFMVGCQLISTTETISITLPPIVTTTSNDLTTDELNPVSYESLFDNNVKHRFVISFSQANFDKLVQDMINYNDQFGSYRDNTIQEVDILYEDSYGNRVELNEVGFRTKGNIFSRVLPVILDNKGDVIGYQQVSFQLEFNDTFNYPDNSTQYKLLKERRMFDLEQLNFKAIRSGDTGVVTEMVAYDLYLAAGVPAPNTSLAIIYFDIDGTLVPYGLFTVTEPLDDVYARRVFGKNFDGSLGDLYKCVWQSNGPATLKTGDATNAVGVSDYNAGYRLTYQLKTNKLTSDFSNFSYFVQELNNFSNTVSYQNKLEDILDVDTWLKTLAMGFLIGNPDDYAHDANNFYLYFYENQAVYIPFDHDQSLGFGWDPYNGYGINHDLYDYPVAQTYHFSKNDLVLVKNVFAFPEYRDLYEKYIIEYTDETTGIFDYDRYYGEYIVAKTLYQSELTENHHLGVTTFSLTQRYMQPSDYFTQKSENARAYALYYQDQN